MTITDVPLELSRPSATANSLGDLAPGSARFFSKAVLITGEKAVIDTGNGLECLLNSIRLVMRICENVSIYLPSPEATIACQRLVDEIALHCPATFMDQEPDYSNYSGILSIGVVARGHLPWTVINSNGFVARVSSTEKSISADCSQYNPIGALAAAALGTSELFKRLINLKPERGELFDGLAFSFFSYTATEDPGAELPSEVPVALTMVGAGAIGNATAHLLSQLPTSGSIEIVDNQNYGTENWGTCLLIGPLDLGQPKAEVLGRILERRLQVKPFRQSITDFRNREANPSDFIPKIIVNGLDNIDARHDVQQLWPDNIFDGAIGDFACEATLHPWESELSCLICDFQQPDRSAAEAASEATGLPQERVSDLQTVISEADVASAAPEKQAWLKAQVGKQMCSVISEAIARQISNEDQPEGFRPSVPFVAALSAVMVVTELVRYSLKWPTILETGYQFDVLRGPQFGRAKSHSRRPNCICVTRSSNIERLRRSRDAN